MRCLLMLLVVGCQGSSGPQATTPPPSQPVTPLVEGAGSDLPVVSTSPRLELDASGLCGFDAEAVARLEWYLAAHPGWHYARTESEDSLLSDSRIAILRTPAPVMRGGAMDDPSAQVALIIGPRPFRWAGTLWGGQHRFQVFAGPEMHGTLELHRQPYRLDDPDLFSGVVVECDPLSIAVTEVGGNARPLTQAHITELARDLSRLKDHDGALVDLLPQGAVGAASMPRLGPRHRMRQTLTGSERMRDGLEGHVNPGEPGHLRIRALVGEQNVGQQFPHERERVGWSSNPQERFYFRATNLRYSAPGGHVRFELWFHPDAGTPRELVALCVDVNEWIESPCSLVP